jgi:hypothetical protein
LHRAITVIRANVLVSDIVRWDGGAFINPGGAMAHIKSARQIADEMIDAMRRYSSERQQATEKMKAPGTGVEGAYQLISANGEFLIDLSGLLGDALDTIRILAALEGRDQLADGDGMYLAEG